MDALTTPQLNELKASLLEIRAQLDGRLADNTSSQPVDLDKPIGRLTRMDEMQQQRMALEERRRARIRRAQVQAALDLMETGDYGECKRCEEPIALKRLVAAPETPFCVPCMSAFERR